jgi:hypothetical protein
MLYARELIEFMGAWPGRDFKMVELVGYIANGRVLDIREKRAVRKAALRAVEALSASGCILVRPPRASRGGFAHYRWKA